MTPEGKLVAYIKRVVIAAGGQVRKCEWAGHAGAAGCHVFVVDTPLRFDIILNLFLGAL